MLNRTLQSVWKGSTCLKQELKLSSLVYRVTMVRINKACSVSKCSPMVADNCALVVRACCICFFRMSFCRCVQSRQSLEKNVNFTGKVPANVSVLYPPFMDGFVFVDTTVPAILGCARGPAHKQSERPCNVSYSIRVGWFCLEQHRDGQAETSYDWRGRWPWQGILKIRPRNWSADDRTSGYADATGWRYTIVLCLRSSFCGFGHLVESISFSVRRAS